MHRGPYPRHGGGRDEREGHEVRVSELALQRRRRREHVVVSLRGDPRDGAKTVREVLPESARG